MNAGNSPSTWMRNRGTLTSSIVRCLRRGEAAIAPSRYVLGDNLSIVDIAGLA